MRLALAALLLAAPTARAAVPPATPTGPAQNCVSLAELEIRQSEVRSDAVIDFVSPGGRSGWRVTLPHACPELGTERRFAYATSLSRLCSTDTITVLYDAPLSRGATCGLGPFQPVTYPKR